MTPATLGQQTEDRRYGRRRFAPVPHLDKQDNSWRQRCASPSLSPAIEAVFARPDSTAAGRTNQAENHYRQNSPQFVFPVRVI
jgi:hypothetical protein